MLNDEVHLTRRAIAHSLAIGLPALSLSRAASAAAPSVNTGNPARTWERFANPEAAGFRLSALQAMEQTLYGNPTTSLMVVKAGKIAYSNGDTAHVSYLASARKSVMSMLYGKHVANGKIDLKRTIGDLGIDEGGEGLLPIEKTATVRDLLMRTIGISTLLARCSSN